MVHSVLCGVSQEEVLSSCIAFFVKQNVPFNPILVISCSVTVAVTFLITENIVIVVM